MANPSLRTERTILVTGGTGTLGRVLVRRLSTSPSVTVAVVTREADRAASVLPNGVHVVTGDVTAGSSLGLSGAELASLRACVTDIVHCAAETTFNRPLEEARASNVGGTQSLLEF